MNTTVILLPGLNGTTGLFKPILELIQDQWDVLTIEYPTDQENSYQRLTCLVLQQLDSVRGKFIIVGESFSGPVALFVAQTKPTGLSGVVLVGSFIQPPNFKIFRFLPWRIGFSLFKPLYDVITKLSIMSKQTLIADISVEMQRVSPRVLSSRIEEIFTVNATEALRNCPVPMVYFRATKDFIVPKRNLAEVLSINPATRVVTFNTHHFLLQSEPEKALCEISRFESDLTPLRKP